MNSLVAAIAAMTALSQFHRNAIGVLAPELATELQLSPEQLGGASGAFFAALLLMQLPVGLALDRIGPRRVVAGLTGLAVAGAMAQAAAWDGPSLLAARFLLGLGCGASFMAAIVVAARWNSGAALTGALSRIFALSQAGVLMAGAPLAAASGVLGWRGAFVASGLLTGAIGLWWWRVVRDWPPGRSPAGEGETLRQALAGQLTVWRTPGLLPILSMHSVAYAAPAAVLGLWAGPYLADVHGLGAGPRGLALLLMGLALPLGQLATGPLERRFNTRKWVVVAGACLCLAFLAGLALLVAPPLWLVLLLLVGLCGAAGYPIVVVAHGRSLFPDHLVGRGATTVNMAQVLGSAALPALMGAAVGLFPADTLGVRPEAAYRLGFAVLGGCLALGLLGYLASRDAPPRR